MSQRPARRPSAPRRGSRNALAVGALVTSVLCAGGLFVLLYDTPGSLSETAVGADAGAQKPARRSPSDTSPPRTLVTGQWAESDAQNLLASQPESKRNQILVIDLFRQILDRYPDGREQRDWLETEGGHARVLKSLRARHATETEVANAIAGALMDSAAYKARVPVLTGTGSYPEDSSALAGALLARAVHYRDDIPRSNDAGLVSRLARDFGLTAETQNRLPTMTRLLRGITGSTDVGEHFIEDRDDDAVELAAMKTFLRAGRLLVLNGNDVEPNARNIVVFGFDPAGDFLVRDPARKMPEKVKGAFLMAFLRKPSTVQDTSGAGFWLDLPGGPTRVKCVAHAAPAPAEPEAAPVELAWETASGMTGVIPGAQVNLTSLRIPPGEHTLRGTLSLNAQQIDDILRRAGSPAAGNGAAFVKWGQYFNVDPAYALAFFRRESVFGTHPRWIGRKHGGGTTKNIGNIRYVGHPNPQRVPQYDAYNGFRDYATWADGIHDWFKLIAQDANYAGLHTVERILPRYAPSVENDTDVYLRDVVRWVGEWRSAVMASLGSARTVAQASEPASAPVEMECKPPDL